MKWWTSFCWQGFLFFLEMHLIKPGFTYSAGGTFSEKQEKIQQFKQTQDSRNIYQNQLDKTCFQHNMTHKDLKCLHRNKASDKALREKAFDITENVLKCLMKGLLHLLEKFIGYF